MRRPRASVLCLTELSAGLTRALAVADRFEDDGTEDFAEDFAVPVLDMRAYLAGSPGALASFAAELGRSLTDIGFAVLTGHGIEPSLFEAAEAAATELIDRPLEEKLPFEASRPERCSVNQGYFGKGDTSSLTADLVEGWVLARRAFRGLADPLGPAGQHAPLTPADGGGCNAEGCFLPPDCAGGEVERTLTRYLQALEALPKPLTRALLHFLGDPQPERMDALMTHPSMALRLNYYPPISTAEDQSGAGRLLGHEDVTFMTLLPAPRTEGLQIFHRASRAWVRLQAPPGSIILNTGDYMQRISADRSASLSLHSQAPTACTNLRTSMFAQSVADGMLVGMQVLLDDPPRLQAAGAGGQARGAGLRAAQHLPVGGHHAAGAAAPGGGRGGCGLRPDQRAAIPHDNHGEVLPRPRGVGGPAGRRSAAVRGARCLSLN